MVSISLHNSFAWVDIIVFFVGDVAPRQWPRCPLDEPVLKMIDSLLNTTTTTTRYQAFHFLIIMRHMEHLQASYE